MLIWKNALSLHLHFTLILIFFSFVLAFIKTILSLLEHSKLGIGTPFLKHMNFLVVDCSDFLRFTAVPQVDFWGQMVQL